MAADIVPIQLGLTEGNLVTLWAPTWVEDGEEWEAFLGHGDNLYGFTSPAHLAAFIRSTDEHDLADHPEWETAVTALADELTPAEDHQFDIVGVPDLVSEPADLWSIAELADTVAILRSIADVCDVEVIHEVLDSSDGFAMLSVGEAAFVGRNGEKLWDEIGSVVVDKWDSVLDALDTLVNTPEVDAAELATAEDEVSAIRRVASSATGAGAAEGGPTDGNTEFAGAAGLDDEAENAADRPAELAFWDELGIDVISVRVDERTGWSLRTYLDDLPVFLAKDDRPLFFDEPAGLAAYVSRSKPANSLSELAVYEEIRAALSEGTAEVVAGAENTYVLDGVADELRDGPGEVHPHQLDLACELLSDAATARGDEETTEALNTASPLGNLVSAIISPDEDRMIPFPPYDDEAEAFEVLVERFTGTIDWNAAETDPADTD